MATVKICDECGSVIGSDKGQKKPIHHLRLPLTSGEALCLWAITRPPSGSTPGQPLDICSECGIKGIKSWLADIGAL